MTASSPLHPIPSLEGIAPYQVPRHPALVDLILDGNEGRSPDARLFDRLVEAGPEILRRYPSPARLEAAIARKFGVEPARVLVTAGADDAIDRCCRAMLCEEREIVLPVPTFEMIPRYARLAGATIRTVDWPDGPYPTNDVLRQVNERTHVIVVISPNNPTGAVATPDDVRKLALAAPRALVLLDLAYVEFADEDLTPVALSMPNVVVLRTMSKAWGMAGLRVGYVLGPPHVLGWLRAAGHPYAVSGPSLLMAAARVEAGDGETQAYVGQVRSEREKLTGTLAALGAKPTSSHGNFVFARTPRAGWIRDALAGMGISVRAWPGHPELDGCVRITCPGDERDFHRLDHAVRAALAPQALLFDMDGPLADVSSSYRQAVIQTAAEYGVTVTAGEIAAAKSRGHANNDWLLTRALLAEHGVEASIEEVTARFEAIYQGTGAKQGLWRSETLVPRKEWLVSMASKMPLAVVTGRPRQDATRFLRTHGIEGIFQAVVCMEDGPLKPDPAPVRRAMDLLGVRTAWMIGDTPDDMRAARGAGAVPLGVTVPGGGTEQADALVRAGAARVLPRIDMLEELLP
jgi:histidinol-phosphate aminotransferase